MQRVEIESDRDWNDEGVLDEVGDQLVEEAGGLDQLRPIEQVRHNMVGVLPLGKVRALLAPILRAELLPLLAWLVLTYSLYLWPIHTLLSTPYIELSTLKRIRTFFACCALLSCFRASRFYYR